MPVPTARLAVVVAVASLAVVWLPPSPGGALLIVNGALLVAAIVDGILAPRPGAIGVERDLPAVLPLGGAGTIAWRVRNRGARRVQVALADELAPSLRAGSRRARLSVPAHGSATATTTLRPRRRGLFEPAEISVRVEGPMG